MTKTRDASSSIGITRSSTMLFEALVKFCGLAIALGLTSGAHAQTYTVTSVTQGAPDIGYVVSGTTTTTFTIAPGGGLTQGPGGAIQRNAGNTVVQFTVSCLDQKGNCRSTSATITVSGGPADGRAGALTNFSVLSDPAIQSATGGAPLQIILVKGAIASGASKTFTIGMDFPILATGTTGTLAPQFSVCITTVCANGAGKVQVPRPLSVAKNQDLDFGTIAAPGSGASAGNVTVNPETGSRSASGGVGLVTSVGSSGRFTVTGEGGQVVSISVPNFQLSKSGATPLTVTPSLWSISNTLSGGFGATGTLEVRVGGTLSNITSATPVGTYTGTFTVTANYN